MKINVLIGILLFCAFSAFGQAVDTAAVVREVDSLITKIQYSLDNGEIEEAQKLAEISVEMLGYCSEQESLDCVKRLYKLGLLYKSLGIYDTGILLLNSSMKLFEKILGQDDDTYLANVINLANLYINAAQYDNAEKLLNQARNQWLKRGDTRHRYYAYILNSLGYLYENTNRLNEVEALYLEAKNIRAEVLGPEHADYIRTLFHIGTFYQKIGRYEEAENNLVEARVLWAKTFGTNQTNYANIINGLANIYWELGEYKKAEPLICESINIWKSTQGSEHPNYASGLDNLGMLYLDIGLYDKVEPLFLEAKNIRKSTLGVNHPDYAITLNHLASYYEDIGLYEKAVLCYEEELAIQSQVLPTNHPDHTATLLNLGNLYSQLGQLAKAERIITEVKDIYQQTLGHSHPNYGSACINLARVQIESGNYEMANLYLLEAKEIFEQSLGTAHPRYANCLKNLGIVYERTGRFVQAEQLYQSALKIKENALVKTHRDIITSNFDLAIFYQKQGSDKEASLHYKTAFALLIKAIKDVGQYCSELEAILFHKRYDHYKDSYFSYLTEFPTDEGFTDWGGDYLVQMKHTLLDNKIQIQKLAYQTTNDVFDKYNNWQDLLRRLASEYAKPQTERGNIADLEEKTNTLEKYLVRSMTGFGDAIRQISWRDVQSALQPHEAALEFIHFNYYNPEPTDSVLYAALVLKPGMPHPLFIPLCEEKQLKALLPAAGVNINRDQVNELYGINPGDDKNALYHLLWAPLEKHLSGVRTVYYSPSGLLHRLNLSALPVSAQTTLSGRHDLVVLGSTRQLVAESRNTAPVGSSAALVYGGIQFNMDSTAYPVQTAGNTGGERGLSFSQTDSTLRSTPWTYLKGSEKEVDNVRAALEQAGQKTVVLKGWQATEESFKQIGQTGPSPRILHVSTHGYFFPDPQSVPRPRDNPQSAIRNPQSDEPVFKLSEHPMIRSGLILAGANHAWQTGRPLGNREDGVLTAYEISQLDLRNTELVVLSACETGLGHIEGNEGVYGLQRAFKIAGAKTLVMSLWQVPDYQTQELMTAFYQKWLSGKMPVRQALHAAQKEMRDKGYEPFFWAGFVVVE